MSKLVTVASVLSLALLTACEGAPAAESTGGSPAEPATDVAESDLSASSSCDQNELFVKQGLAQDMRDTLAPSFLTGYQIVVPGAIRAYDSYGGDMVQTVLGASAGAERVFAPSPGGAFAGRIEGWTTNPGKLSTRGLAAARALFDAMTGAVQTSSTAQGWTTTTRTSKGGRFACELRTEGGALRSGSCSFKDLLMIRTVSWPKTATDFCVR